MKLRVTRRRVLVGAAALGLVVLIALARRPAAATVETAVVAEGPLHVTVEEDGRTRAVDRYVVTAPVSGAVERIELREGTRVERGAVLARIEPLPVDAAAESALRSALTAAESRRGVAAGAVQQAQVARDQAAREVERRRQLAAEGAIPAEQLEQYTLSLQAHEEQLRTAQQQLRSAAADEQAARSALRGAEAPARTARPVLAPASGTLLRVAERSARVVAAGTPLLEIGDPQALEVVVDVLTTDAVRIEPGMRATVRNWGGEPIGATVRLVEPSAFTRVSALGVEEQRVNVLLQLDERPPQLGDGYRLDAAITVWSAERVLGVPSAALFRTGDAWAVFVVDEGRARLRQVTLGERSGTTAQVLDGLRAGDVVILFPSDQLTEGQRVRPR